MATVPTSTFDSVSKKDTQSVKISGVKCTQLVYLLSDISDFWVLSFVLIAGFPKMEIGWGVALDVCGTLFKQEEYPVRVSSW